ncbi:helix-turn-helix domain containing protein [Pseudomonas sp. DCB_BI]|uniref:helix-turn-helix domain-containing protein n=1 Tax=Pseudomonas sp. DCB_BI TaxID=2993594 RepID=UPI00224B18E9|nr:helix-turn-helix domain-containing protein [Pseudomonas sp. DCB_BI]MCX2889833.1 helix-turn-helix domain containing protein [Pseudomonas sp. DCB_BI]
MHHHLIHVDGLVVDTVTGEILGYDAKPSIYQGLYDCMQAAPQKPKGLNSRHHVVDYNDGSPVPTNETIPNDDRFIVSASAEKKSNAGAKQRVVKNPFYALLDIAKFEKVKLPFVDGYIHGAIHIGPGIINGRYSVAASDVRQVLHQPLISRDVAVGFLRNHESGVMSKTQADRVVLAARIALGGIALYLERNPDVLATFDLTVDFDLFWKELKEIDSVKIEALAMLDSGMRIKDVAEAVGRSRNTVSTWKREAINHAQFAPDVIYEAAA